MQALKEQRHWPCATQSQKMLLQYGRDLHTYTYWTHICRGHVFVCRNRDSKQIKQETHSLYGHMLAGSRLKSRKEFLTTVKQSYFPLKAVRCNVGGRSMDKLYSGMVSSNEEPAKGYDGDA